MHAESVQLAARVVTPMLVSVALTGAALAQPTSGSRSVYAIGDSWAAGLYADPAHALIQDAADDLGATATVDGESGSGYLVAPPGRSTYPARARRIPPGTDADLVIVQGGSNDDRADLRALPGAVEQTVDGIRHALPDAAIVLLGPGPDPWPVTGLQRTVDTIIGAEAARLGVRAVSPLREGWFTAGDVDELIDPVTAHPTVEGDAVLGADLAGDLRRGAHGSRRAPALTWPTPPAQRTTRSRVRGRL